MLNKKNTYVSLFSCAGIGCHGFTLAQWQCLATCELNPSFMQIQQANHKCLSENQYICGDLTSLEVQKKLYETVEHELNVLGDDFVDLVIASPPCQGMSLLNHKRQANDLNRNSLVCVALDIIERLSPKIFILENVRSFLKTKCVHQGVEKSIYTAIYTQLGERYTITTNTINLAEYGSQSSRTRTFVIGVRKEYTLDPQDHLPPIDKAKPLWEVIGHLPSLKTMGEICPHNVWHSFRTYKQHMRAWISNVKPGESAFNNSQPHLRPHSVIDGTLVEHKHKAFKSDKYQRAHPERVGPCVHTRNDIFSSQTTIHPYDDRVFSIAELMCMLSIPQTFRWTSLEEHQLRTIPRGELLKLERIVRYVLGECIPTHFIYRLAKHLEAQAHLQLAQG